MEKVDYKKQFKELYAPGFEPSVIKVPPMNFIMVDGMGNPNENGGQYQSAVDILYALTYTIKMSRLGGSAPAGYFDYVVPPLEGLWWLEDLSDMDFTRKEKYHWISMIRQPEFVTNEVFDWAKDEVKKKKHLLEVKARFETFEEGLCVQVMHRCPFDLEPASLAKIDSFMKAEGYVTDIGSALPDGKLRRHHEIYLSDPRKLKPENMKTILRHPVRIA
jgi:hypothetical protein